ncbi:hypothetical protein L208DRAFT_1405614 [Tricholoma matsutake]|nr:hypothetical protein L208DRAFT_1405614 [Tricholoma matsutake 945]
MTSHEFFEIATRCVTLQTLAIYGDVIAIPPRLGSIFVLPSLRSLQLYYRTTESSVVTSYLILVEISDSGLA